MSKVNPTKLRKKRYMWTKTSTREKERKPSLFDLTLQLSSLGVKGMYNLNGVLDDSETRTLIISGKGEALIKATKLHFKECLRTTQFIKVLYSILDTIIRAIVWLNLYITLNEIHWLKNVPQEQTRLTVDLVKKYFDQLHHFLCLEEAAQISMLEDEAEMKNKIMQEKLKDLSNKILSLSNTIQNKESDLEKEDIQFLQVTNQ